MLVHWLLAITGLLVIMALTINAFPNLQTDIENMVGGKERVRLIGALWVILSSYMLFRKKK